MRTVTDEEAAAAWDQYVFDSHGAERGSYQEAQAWERYMDVLNDWRSQR